MGWVSLKHPLLDALPLSTHSKIEPSHGTARGHLGIILSMAGVYLGKAKRKEEAAPLLQAGDEHGHAALFSSVNRRWWGSLYNGGRGASTILQRAVYLPGSKKQQQEVIKRVLAADKEGEGGGRLRGFELAELEKRAGVGSQVRNSCGLHSSFCAHRRASVWPT